MLLWTLAFAALLAKGQSPRDFIAFLNYQSDDRRGRPMVSGCGVENEDRKAATTLAKMGPSALPDIERELDSVPGRECPQCAVGTGWLLDAYARIKGTEAFPRLRMMASDPRLAYWRGAFDGAIALSLGLTDYISESEELSTFRTCCRVSEPRRALNVLILAWERNDREAFESSLGPGARGALNRLLHARSWADLRTGLWRATPAGQAAVGYICGIRHKWAEPEEILDDEKNYAASGLNDDHPEIETEFKNSSGAHCGRQRIRFIKTPVDHTKKGKTDKFPYLVDARSLKGLLRLIGSCAAQ